jgi:hypothetical protein
MDEVTAAALHLIGAYQRVHPELGIFDAGTTAELLHPSGTILTTRDDGQGRFEMYHGGEPVLRLDLTPLLGPTEP